MWNCTDTSETDFKREATVESRIQRIIGESSYPYSPASFLFNFVTEQNKVYVLMNKLGLLTVHLHARS